MARPGQSTVWLETIPTQFDLPSTLSRLAEEAERTFEEEDTGEDTERSSSDEGRRVDHAPGAVGSGGGGGGESGSACVLTSENTSAGRSTRKKRNEARKLRRMKKREHDARRHGQEDEGLKTIAIKRRMEVLEAQAFSTTETRGEDLKAAEGGWMGSLTSVSDQKESNLQQVLDRGLKLIRWDGRRPHAILDKSQRVVAVLAGMARGNFEDDVVAKATAVFEEESKALPPSGRGYTRGRFHAILTGITHGGGTPEPVQTATESAYKSIAERLKRNEAVARLAGFQNQTFQTYFPQTHAYYRRSMEALRREKKGLAFPFVNSLPSAAFNLGPRTVCTPHRDAKNLAFGICCITALGGFDPVAGGHLVLEELQLVVEFPPGATVLIPSAVVTHSNTGIQEGERRYSFTQYASGSLFSYVENGMRTTRSMLPALSQEERAARKHMGCMRWSKGLSMFPFIWDYEKVASS